MLDEGADQGFEMTDQVLDGCPVEEVGVVLEGAVKSLMLNDLQRQVKLRYPAVEVDFFQ